MRNARCLKKNQSGACKAVILILRQIHIERVVREISGEGSYGNPLF